MRFTRIKIAVAGLALLGLLGGIAWKSGFARSSLSLVAATVNKAAQSDLPAGRPVGAPAAFDLELKKDGAFNVLYDQVPLVSAGFRFWGSEWKWAGAAITTSDIANDASNLNASVASLGVHFNGKLSAATPGQLIYDLTVKRDSARSGVIGGGIEFLLNRNSAFFGGRQPARPTLLPGNTGWEWELESGQTMKAVFEPAIGRVFFEKNDPGKIRAFFIDESFQAGTTPLKLVVTLLPNTKRLPTESEQYGPVDTARWMPNAFPYPHSPVDLSHLNHVPGKHGFLKRDGQRLVFEDGTPAKFWGINVMANALFAPDRQIQIHAKRLAMLGFNLVRMHHHDTMAWVKPTIIDKESPTTRRLDANGLERIDYWIKCLRENGIYVWLDMHSYRIFREGDRETELGTIATFNEFMKAPSQKGEVKGFCQYDPALQKLMAELEEHYLSHVNRHTGVAYKDDPAVAFVLLTNENDLTLHYGNRAIPTGGFPELNKQFNERTQLFADRSGLNVKSVRQPWMPGSSKMFLNDQEHEFNRLMTEPIRRIGSKALIATGHQWGNNQQFCVPSLTEGDVIDVHQYNGPGTLSTDPRQVSNIAASIGFNQIAGMPLTVSEWNMVDRGELAVDRFVAPIYVASIAALQGWDALMLYGYCQAGLTDGYMLPGIWDALNDPALMASMPAAALSYRSHVSPAKKTYCLDFTPAQMFGPALSASNSAAARTLMEQSRFTLGVPETPELPWLKPLPPEPGATSINDPSKKFLADDATSVASDTGELRRDWKAGVQTIDTPKSQVVQGAIGEQEIRLSNVSVHMQIRNATVAVTSLDDRPINDSKRVLITTVARAVKPGHPVRKVNGKPDVTVFSEPVRGEITIEAVPGLEAFALSSRATESPLPGVTYQQGRYRIPLGGRPSHWYLLRAPQASAQ